MKKSELHQIIKEEMQKILKDGEFYTVFGGVHSDEQLDSLEDVLKIYKSKDPKVWEDYVKLLKRKGYDKPTHKEHPHYIWALSKLTKFTQH